MKKITTEYKTTVEFYDLDPMGVIWHGNFIKYLEAARCDFLEKIGYDYVNLKEDNSMYPIAKMDLKFIKPGVFRQKIKVLTTLTSIEPSLNFKYIIKDDENDETILKASTMQIRVDINTKESLYKAPERFIEKIEEYNK